MKTTRFIAALALMVGAVLGCAKESSRGPVLWTASNPSSPVGQTAAQAWSRSTSSDTPQPASEAPRPTATIVPAPQGASGDEIELPSSASLTASAAVNEIGPFPEESQQASARANFMVSTAVAHGTDRMYESELSYGEAVAFFDETLSKNGCEDAPRTTTSATTIWSIRCPDGQRAQVAVRSTRPTTIEVVAEYVREEPSGVTNAQPPAPRWPYDRVTLRLGPTPPQ